MRRLKAILVAALTILAAGCDPKPTSLRQPNPPTNASPVSSPWFQEVAATAGLHFHHSSGHRDRFFMPEINTGGVGLLDFDRDGRLDVFCVNGGSVDPAVTNAPGHRLFRNLGDWRFEDATAQAGVGANRNYGMGVACADFDGDGWTDIYLLNLRTNVLWKNQGDGTFTNVTESAGVGGQEWSSSAAFFDYDQDGHLDLAVANYLHWSMATEVNCFSRGGVPDYCSPLSYRAPSMDRLYHNRGDGTFDDVSLAAGLGTAYGNGLGITTGDFDRDGRVDFFVANDATPNQLWLNQGEGRFHDAALLRGCALNSVGIPRAGMGVVAVDLQQRGWLDLFVTHLVGEGNGLFVNSNGLFTDVITPQGPMNGSRPFTGFGVGFHDFDHDGELDVLVANGRVRLGASDIVPTDPYAEPNSLLRGEGRGNFSIVEPAGGTSPPLLATSRGAAFGDLDNDGAVDVVILNKDGPLHVLRNIVGAGGRWIGLDVRDALGRVAHNAIVRLEAGNRPQWRQVQPNEGYSSSHDPRLNFGLSAVAEVDRVWVRWPSGAAESFGPLAAGSYHELRQGRGTPAPGSFPW